MQKILLATTLAILISGCSFSGRNVTYTRVVLEQELPHTGNNTTLPENLNDSKPINLHMPIENNSSQPTHIPLSMDQNISMHILTDDEINALYGFNKKEKKSITDKIIAGEL